MAETLEGNLCHGEAAYAIVAARFNEVIVERLLHGAVDALRRHGVPESNLTVVRCPGAFEIPALTRRLLNSGRFQGVVALGCVIRGATAHFDYVCAACTGGLGAIAAETGSAIGMGVLTTETMEQALDRAGGKTGNKGADAALAMLEQVNLGRAIDALG